MDLSPEELSVEELFESLRKLGESQDIAERLRTLWFAAAFGVRLEQCSDGKIGDLLAMVQEHMGLFSGEYAVCEMARRRLQRSSLSKIVRRLLK